MRHWGSSAVSSAPAGQPGLGSGANNTARYLGGAAGIAIVVAVAVPTSARPTTAQFVAGWDTAASVCAVLCALGIAAALLLRDRLASKVPGTGPVPEERIPASPESIPAPRP